MQQSPTQPAAACAAPTHPLLAKTLQDYLDALDDPRRAAVLAFHDTHRDLIYRAHGSSHNHQAWPGGYADHLAETLRIAEVLYTGLSALRPLPFTLASAHICLYLHDIEKIWQYTTGLPADFNKGDIYTQQLPTVYGLPLTADELNALEYAHGEGDDHRKDKRVMNELAALVHAADNLSARLWHSDGRGLGA